MPYFVDFVATDLYFTNHECDDSDSEEGSSDEEQVEEPSHLSNRAMVGMMAAWMAARDPRIIKPIL